MARNQWRRMEREWWWRSHVGSAIKRSDGWYVSASGYPDVILDPAIGPFATVDIAIETYEKMTAKLDNK